MAETDFQTGSEPADELAQIRAILHTNTETLGRVLDALRTQTDTLRIVADTIGRAAPLLDSKAARVALGVERHPILSALKGGGGRG